VERTVVETPGSYVVLVPEFIDQVQDIITVGEFYEKAAGEHIILTILT